MKIFNNYKVYSIWTFVSIFLAAIYVKIILGAKPESSSDFNKMFVWLYDYVFVILGFVLGSFNAFIFILIDVFYLKKKNIFGIKLTMIRLFALVLVTIASGITHYFLEKVFNVI